MSANLREVTCALCGTALDDDLDAPAERRQPCPNCGSTARNAHIYVSGSAVGHSSLRLRQKRPGFLGRSGRSKGGLVREVLQGEEQSADGSWVDKVRVKDREADRYAERVVAKDGTVLHDVDEPLSEHRRRG
jgi:hypothetical protein